MSRLRGPSSRRRRARVDNSVSRDSNACYPSIKHVSLNNAGTTKSTSAPHSASQAGHSLQLPPMKALCINFQPDALVPNDPGFKKCACCGQCVPADKLSQHSLTCMLALFLNNWHIIPAAAARRGRSSSYRASMYVWMTGSSKPKVVYPHVQCSSTKPGAFHADHCTEMQQRPGTATTLVNSPLHHQERPVLLTS